MVIHIEHLASDTQRACGAVSTTTFSRLRACAQAHKNTIHHARFIAMRAAHKDNHSGAYPLLRAARCASVWYPIGSQWIDERARPFLLAADMRRCLSMLASFMHCSDTVQFPFEFGTRNVSFGNIFGQFEHNCTYKRTRLSDEAIQQRFFMELKCWTV